MVKKSTKTEETEEVSENIENDEEPVETKEITEEMIKFVREHASGMTYKKMADELGIKKTVVSNILQNYKRKLRSKIGYESYEKRTYINQKDKKVTRPDFSKPKTEKAEKVEKWISDNLSRPVKASNMGDAINDDIDGVISTL